MSHFYDILFWQYVWFFYVMIHCWRYLFSFILMQNSVSMYVHFDFFVLVLGFFNQLIIIVWCSFDSKQFPEIKTNKTILFPNVFRCSPVSRLPLNPRLGVKVGEDAARRSIYAGDYSPKPQCLIHFQSLQWFPFILKSGIISIQMKSRAEQLNAVIYLYIIMQIHTRFIDAIREIGTGRRKQLLEGPESSQQRRNGFGFPLESGLCESAQPNEILRNHMAGYELLNGSSTCFRSPFSHRPYFVQMGLHRAGH